MLISEIFYSLQGEGPWIGFPAIFIRLGGCLEPLCPWCDTPYALFEMEEWNHEQILTRLQPYPCKRVVITGGEPFLQWDNGLSGLHGTLQEQGYILQYETSGKIKIPPVMGAMVVCSPKYIDGAWHFDQANLDIADCYKFLAGSPGSFQRIVEFVSRYGIEKERVYIMPLGASRLEQINGMDPVFTFCMEKGYRMTPRLHVLAFDTRRGV